MSPDTSDCVPTCAATVNCPRSLGPGCRRKQADHRGRHEPATSLHRPPLRHRGLRGRRLRAECNAPRAVCARLALQSRATCPCRQAPARVSPCCWRSPAGGGAAAERPAPGREQVLKQVRVPHHYYYREMYLPQADERRRLARLVARRTGSSPSRSRARSGGWSPGRASRAQLTDGPGYDYQPDWSPDGRLARLRLLPRRRGRAARARAREREPLAAHRRTAPSTSSRAARPTAAGSRSSRRRTRGASTCSCSS